jgi:8-oxo-dGTP diphosphatase
MTVRYLASAMADLPYKIAVLCYVFDEQERLLLLHRTQEPNKGLYSPPGGKLKMHLGESPADCALREMREELLLDLNYADIRLAGLVSETAFGGHTHWLMFLYEVVRPVEIKRMEFEEGRLEWHPWSDAEQLPIPETDRRVIYPLFRKYRGRFFHVHIDCTDEGYRWRLESPAEPQS